MYRLIDDDVAIVRQAFAAFAARDVSRLEELTSASLILTNPPTGSVLGRPRYEGRGALTLYLADVERVWDSLELWPQTFHSPRPGEVLVAGSVIVRREGETRELAAAWSWGVVDGKITSIRVLPAGDPPS